MGNFLTRSAAPRVGNLERTDGERVLNISAEVAEGVLADDKVQEIQRWLAGAGLDPAVNVKFRGENEDQREAETFLMNAFAAALFLIAIILVVQFNSFYQALLILSAVVFSTVGVLIGLLITDQPFGVVMCGIGIISLAGIVVSNNIVLIDTYNIMRRRGLAVTDAILLTCAQRLRPVMLTTITTILGLLPIVFGMNIDLVRRTRGDRRPVDAMVDATLHGDRRRPDLRDDAHARADAVPAALGQPLRRARRRAAAPLVARSAPDGLGSASRSALQSGGASAARADRFT